MISPTGTHESIACPLQPSGYGAPFDELLDSNGEFRKQWQDFLPFLRPEGLDELDARWQQSERILRDNGVAYNVYNDPKGMLRPWKLDAVPLCLSGKEWSFIEKSLIQRATLLNRLLEDFYGPQETLKKGLLPAELVLSHPSFLRPCHGLPVPNNIRLHLYAADLARSADGNWWVLADRTQSPSGAGYALENRIVMTQVYPECFRKGHIERLASFFRSQQSMLASLSSNPEPRIVLLSPGPYNETYFEHAYLARYLGYTLAEGSDLTVRNQKVYLKTLGGLRQVDVILRRVDDSYCDPLELRDDSLLGIPGLVEAIRSGNVAVANSLGSSLAQTPALSAFLPTLCKTLLNQDLLLPSVATWWCGQGPARTYVENNLHGLVIRPTIPGHNAAPVFGRDLTAQQRNKLLSEIKARPSHYVAQELVQLSKAPAYTDGSLRQLSLTLRVFLASDGQGSYTIMPGGLTRIAGTETGSTVSMQLGGGSKDTWIRAAKPREYVSMLKSGGRFELRRGSYDLPSRVADNLFWLGRYAERCECTARLFRSVVAELNQERANDMDAILPVLHTLADMSQLSLVPNDALPRELVENTLPRDLLDPNQAGSLRTLVHRLHNIAAMVRDRISTDTWRILNQLSQELEQDVSGTIPQPGDLLIILNNVVLSLSAFSGMASENMTQSLGWRFLQLGRRLERAAYYSHLTQQTLYATGPAPALGSGRMEVLLEIFDCIITYRQKYFALQQDAVLDLIVADEDNPRSLAGLLLAISNHLQSLPRDHTNPVARAEEKLVYRSLNLMRIQEFGDADAKEGYPLLQRNLAQVEDCMNECSNLIALRYFSHLRMSSTGHGDSFQKTPPLV